MSIAELEATEVAFEVPPSGLWSEAWRRLRHNPSAVVGFVIVGTFIIFALFAPLIAPFDPRAQDLSLLNGGCCPGPSPDHIFGVDPLGRDLFSRVVYGARFSLLIGVVSVAVGLSIGLVIGAVAGYAGGAVDSVLMRLMDIMLSIPGLLLAIGIVAALGPGLVQIMVAVGVTQIPIFARLLRSSILAVRRRTTSSRRGPSAYAGGRSWAPRHSELAFARDRPGNARSRDGHHRRRRSRVPGLGPQDPSTPEWGTMLTDTTRYLQTAPFLALIPGAAIVISVLGFNLIGDGLREALDPRFRGRA